MLLTLKEGTILYRGVNNFNNQKKDSVLWLSEDLDTALLYFSQRFEVDKN